MKSVKMLVLCKGGDRLSITSFGFFNRNITTTIPLETVSTFFNNTMLYSEKIISKSTTVND